MKISQNCVELVKRFEGFRAKTYRCIAGYPTIGYGHKIGYGQTYQEISAMQAHDLLIQDLQTFAAAVNRNIEYPLTQNQFDAITSFAYNVGIASLQRSTLRQKINYAELDKVAHEMLKWVYVKALKVQGLVIRRKAEIELFYRP
jgi:lysozyme